MDEQIVELWQQYRAAVERAYRGGESGLEFLGADVSEDLLGEIADLSEQLTAALAEGLEGSEPGEREELEGAAWAAAGIDASVGAEALIALREEAGEPRLRAVAALVDRASPSAETLEPIEVLLARADVAFGMGEAIAGASPPAPQILTMAGNAIDELVDLAVPRTTSFASGMLVVGATSLIGAAGGFDALHEVIDRVGGRLLQGTRLIGLAVRKLIAIVGSPEALDATTDWLLDTIAEANEYRFEAMGEAIVRWAVRASDSRQEVVDILVGGHFPTDVRALDGELDKLCARYARNMRWARVVRKGIAVAAPVIVVAGAGVPGQVAVAGANGTGLVVCLFGLADRLDTLPYGLGWVDGVPELVRR